MGHEEASSARESEAIDESLEVLVKAGATVEQARLFQFLSSRLPRVETDHDSAEAIKAVHQQAHATLIAGEVWWLDVECEVLVRLYEGLVINRPTLVPTADFEDDLTKLEALANEVLAVPEQRPELLGVDSILVRNASSRVAVLKGLAELRAATREERLKGDRLFGSADKPRDEAMRELLRRSEMLDEGRKETGIAPVWNDKTIAALLVVWCLEPCADENDPFGRLTNRVKSARQRLRNESAARFPA